MTPHKPDVLEKSAKNRSLRNVGMLLFESGETTVKIWLSGAYIHSCAAGGFVGVHTDEPFIAFHPVTAVQRVLQWFNLRASILVNV